MYIKNSEQLKEVYRCNGVIAKYLMVDCSIPLLSREGRIFVFSDTPVLKEVLENLPFWLKITKVLS